MGELNGVVRSAGGDAMGIIGQGGSGTGDVEVEIPLNLISVPSTISSSLRLLPRKEFTSKAG